MMTLDLSNPAYGAHGMDVPTNTLKCALNMIMAHCTVNKKDEGFNANAYYPCVAAIALSG